MSDKVENLEQTGTKKVTITGQFDDKKLAALSGVTPTESSNNKQTSFFYNGNLQALLELLASENPKDITITEPSLEEIFMNYYE